MISKTFGQINSERKLRQKNIFSSDWGSRKERKVVCSICDAELCKILFSAIGDQPICGRCLSVVVKKMIRMSRKVNK